MYCALLPSKNGTETGLSEECVNGVVIISGGILLAGLAGVSLV